MKQAETQRGHGEARGQVESPAETKPGEAGTLIPVSQHGGALLGLFQGTRVMIPSISTLSQLAFGKEECLDVFAAQLMMGRGNRNQILIHIISNSVLSQ